MSEDRGLATERTDLSRRRTVLPFLVVAALGVRAALHGDGPAHPWPALALVLVAAVGAVAALRAGPTTVTAVVVVLAVTGALL